MALALHTQSPVTGWISLLEMCIWVFMEQRHGVLVEKLDDGMIGILYYVDTKAYFHLPDGAIGTIQVHWPAISSPVFGTSCALRIVV